MAARRGDYVSAEKREAILWEARERELAAANEAANPTPAAALVEHTCCECGKPASLAQNNFRHAPEAAEWFCIRHASASIRRPWAYL